MSRAVVFDEYGDPDVLHVIEVPIPEPGEGQVVLAVRAAGVQPADTKQRAGAWAKWSPAAFPGARLGHEAAGVVHAVGPGVENLKVGDEVLGPATGAYAEHALAEAQLLAPKPAAMPWSEAGVFSASGQTAHTALEDLKVGEGETLLIHAAAGGVGMVAAQVAIARGARVIGTASEHNHAFLAGLGVVPVTYGPGLPDRVRALAPEGVDAVLDAAGGDSLEASMDLGADKERIGTLVAPNTAKRLGVQSLGTRRGAERLADLLGLYTAGKLKVFVWKEFPLDQAAAAHRESEGRHLRGKIALRP